MKIRLLWIGFMLFSAALLSSCMWMHALAYACTNREDPIYALIYENRIEELEEYCKEHPDSVRDVYKPHFLGGSRPTTPLRDAIFNGREEAARILIEHGAPLDLLGDDPRVFLKRDIEYLESERKYLQKKLAEKPKMLLTPRQRDILGDSGLEEIARKRATLAYITPIYDDFYKKIEKNHVWVSVKRRDAEALRKHLDEGGDKNLARGAGETPLCFAYRNLDSECVRALQEHHAEIGAARVPKQCENIAAELETAMLRHRLSDPKNRSRINVRGKDGESPFTRAVLRGMPTNELAIWLENGADPNARDAKGRAIEECLGEKSWTERRAALQSATKRYLDQRESGEEPDLFWRDEGKAYRIPDKRTEGIPTDSAVSELKKLWKLEFDAEPRFGRGDEREKIWKEFQIRHPEFQIDSRDENGETLLNAAIRAYDRDAVERLLKLGADPRATDADESCPAEDMIECARLAESWKDWTKPSELIYAGEMMRVGGPFMAPWRQKDAKFGKEEYIFFALSQTTRSVFSLKRALDTGIISEDYEDSEGRTIDQIIGSVPEGRDPFGRNAAKELLEKYR